MVNELDPATKPAKKTCYCVECNAAITATQAKNTYSTYDTTLCGECVVDTCATRKEPVPAWNEMPEKLIKGWSESELADWAMRGAELHKTYEDHDVYKTPEPLVPAWATLAGFERVDRNEPDKILRYYKLPKGPQAQTTEAQASEQDQPPHGSPVDRMRSQEPQDASYIEVPLEPRTSQPAPATAAQRRVYAPPAGLTYTREQIDTIRNTIAKGISDSELQMFMHLSQKYGLDPFLKEIYYSGQMKTIITSRDGYLKVAQRNLEFEGIQSMAVCKNDDFSVDMVNNVVNHSFGKGERGDVIGAWAVCYRRGRRPVIAYADYIEYNKGNQIWKTYKSAMCCKVAEVFALKRQFGISGLVTEEEIEARND